MVYNHNYVLDIQNVPNKRCMTDDKLQERLFTLLAAIRQSDEKAFSAFYDTTVNRVYGLVFKILANKMDSEDVVCDVYTQIWQQARNYRPEKGSVIGWCLLIARCRSLDLLRKRQKKSEILSDAGQYLDDFSDPSGQPDKIMQALQEGSDTHIALAQLSSTQRQLIALTFFKGLSHSEISEAINMPLGTVKSNIRRALETLHQSVIG